MMGIAPDLMRVWLMRMAAAGAGTSLSYGLINTLVPPSTLLLPATVHAQSASGDVRDTYSSSSHTTEMHNNGQEFDAHHGNTKQQSGEAMMTHSINGNDHEDEQEIHSPPSMMGRIVLGVAVACGVVLVAGVTPFLTVTLRRDPLPFVPASPPQIRLVLDELRSARRMVDLGSGDGRVCVAAAKQLANIERAHGIEINIWLVLYGKLRALREGVWRRASFRKQDLWKSSLGEFDHVVVFGVNDQTKFMESLENKFLHGDMHPQAKIIACRFPLATFTPIKETNVTGNAIANVWVYDLQAERKRRNIKWEKPINK